MPNGYGSAYRLSGNRRNPWIARKTIGWADDGTQLFLTIGYYKDRPAALQALAEYNKNPYSVEASTVTFAEIFEMWSSEKYPKISASNQGGYNMAYKRSESLHDMKFVDIRKAHMQKVIDDCDKSYGTKKKIKVLYNQLYKFALENDIAVKDYSSFVELGEDKGESNRKPFTSDEINKLWEHVDRMEYIDTILIMIYSGMRPGELLDIRNSNIHLEERIMRGGIKNKTSINRVIPINKKILPLIEKRMSEEEYLVLNSKGNKMDYYNYLKEKFRRIMEQLEMEHKPHDCRHSFATLMDNAGANKLSIKRIMGHASQDVTDSVYTHKDIAELLKAIDLI